MHAEHCVLTRGFQLFVSQECHVDEAGRYTDGTHKMLVGKNVLSEGNQLGNYLSTAVICIDRQIDFLCCDAFSWMTGRASSRYKLVLIKFLLEQVVEEQ